MFFTFLFIHVFVSLVLLGLIWTVQLVHYPSFHFVEESHFVSFEAHHTFSISLIVLPLMIVELVSAFIILFEQNNTLLVLNFTAVILIWLATFTLSVPCHKILSKGKSTEAIDRLVKTNWIRTILWSLKTGFIITYALKHIVK